MTTVPYSFEQFAGTWSIQDVIIDGDYFPFALSNQQPAGWHPQHDLVIHDVCVIYQSATLLPYTPPPVISQGWWEDLSTRTVQPLNAAQIQFTGWSPHDPFLPPKFKEGWERGLDQAITNPFPVTQQRFDNVTPHPPFPLPWIGWYGFQYDYRFDNPYPVWLQRAWEAFSPVYIVPANNVLHGGYPPWIDYTFTKPFNVANQEFEAWPPVQVLAIIPQPGSGRRYRPPTDYLPEPSDRAPRKPIKPIWDRGGEVQPSEPAPRIEGPTPPPPLPPVSIFRATAPVRVIGPDGLPTMQEYVPPRSPLDMRAELERARRDKDAIAALRVLAMLRGK